MQVSQPLTQTVTQSSAQNPEKSAQQNALPSSSHSLSQAAQPDTVTLSANAMTLAAKDSSAATVTSTNEAEILPVEPKLPNEGEKVEDYVDYKKAKAQYQLYADIAVVGTGNSSLTPVSAYYLSNNDDAREAVVNNKAHQQQQAVMQTYVETTQTINVYS
ncbi:hypothetical protein [Shewanella kaireitica]|uniref:hypothetical protein n=1 Tax=Shewanella kaireitica TaxID=212021 RepID=UPI00200D8E81|nr:hypothetical protein [Shewanella kaireitica]MCL1093335.1 hypothetical protein [Shewanella kaireitica]